MDLQGTIEGLGKAFVDFRSKHEGEVSALKAQMDAIETAVARGYFKGGGSSSYQTKAEHEEHKKGFFAWVRKGVDAGLADLEIKAGLSTLSDPDGGFTVPVEMDQELDRLAVQSVAMRRLARIVKTAGEYKRPLSAGGASGGWVAEKGDRNETDSPELKLFAPALAEAYALPEVTQKLLDMSDFDVAGWLVEEINNVLIELEGAGFITGNGVGQPKGFLAYDTVANASWEWGKVGYIAGGHASLMNDVDKLIDLQHALKPIYRQNSTWLMNDTTLSRHKKV